MQRILLAVHLDSFFSGLFGIARHLKGSGSFSPFVLFAQNYSNVPRDRAACRADGIDVLGRTAPEGTAGAGRSVLPAGWIQSMRRIKQRIYHSFLCQWPLLYLRYRSVRSLIRRERLAAIILGGDIAHYDTAVFIKAAHRERIPAIVVAGWMIHQDENAEAFRFDPDIQVGRWRNRITARLFPEWVYAYRGRKLLRLPAGQILARTLLGIAPPRPWTLHSGYADAIAVECAATRDACIRESLPGDRITVTGSINHDMMARCLRDIPAGRRQLCSELGLPDSDRPLLVSALPPDELYRIGGRPECDFRDYGALVEFWMTSLLAAKGWNIVISLHPSLSLERMSSIEGWGVRIARRHTAELVPLCDLFVASVSTTIQWATACGKPVINYDVYRYRQNDYASITGMLAMEDQQTFLAAITRTTSDPAYRADLAAKQQACSHQWGILDGHAGDRLTALLRTWIDHYGSQRGSHGDKHETHPLRS